MRLCSFQLRTPAGDQPRTGRVAGDRVIELAAATPIAAIAGSPEVAEHSLADVQLLCPTPEPPSIRDFLSFEEHVRNARKHRGESVPPEWYEVPVFYFSNTASVFGPEAVIPYPHGSEALDYELEVAAVIGTDGQIAAFTIMNDWSARDLQQKEMRVGLGPAKGKDFASSFGPFLVTIDEFDGADATMCARVNGEERSRGQLGDMYRPWSEIVAHAARNTRLRPGDIIGSGTVATGCILEHGDRRWLAPGDVVELEVEGLGVLRNQVGGDQDKGAVRVV